MKTIPVTFRALNSNDESEVEKLDNLSGSPIANVLYDNIDFAWGLFLNSKLIGYCTTGYADGQCDAIENHALHTSDSILLSDVFILPSYNCWKKDMIKRAIKARWSMDNAKNTVFLVALTDDLIDYYARLGFKLISYESGAMFYTPIDKHEIKKTLDALANICFLKKQMLNKLNAMTYLEEIYPDIKAIMDGEISERNVLEKLKADGIIDDATPWNTDTNTYVSYDMNNNPEIHIPFKKPDSETKLELVAKADDSQAAINLIPDKSNSITITTAKSVHSGIKTKTYGNIYDTDNHTYETTMLYSSIEKALTT